MHLAPHERDKLLVHVAARLARERLDRGLKLNYPEAVALITDHVVEGARDGRSVAEPEIIFRGVPFVDEEDSLVDEIREAVEESLAKSAEEQVREISLLQSHLHDDVAGFVYKRLKRRPMILPVVVEV